MIKQSIKDINSYCNLVDLYLEADHIDRHEGKQAFVKYHSMLNDISKKYNSNFNATVAAFCALSPSSDYLGNLRSLVSVLEGLNNGLTPEKIKTSSYNHCKERAISYLTGGEFVTEKRGLKILNFYFNIIEPGNPSYVTIDGHMVAAFLGDESMTMKQAKISRSEYSHIVLYVKLLAKKIDILPNQLQAILWFTRKRLYRIKYQPNFDLFNDKDDNWGITVDVDAIKPYR